ncbi:MAG: hypothetical protein Q7S54_00155 [bacterium]|nr:hypothetical protein [bacterium]
MRLPYAIQGLLFGPALVGLFILLKAFCPASFAQSCLSDYFAPPIFLPLIFIYRIFGDSAAIFYQDFLFVMLYWALIGFFLGLIFDLWSGSSNDKLPMTNQIKNPND